MSVYEETPIEELRSKIEEAKSLGLVNVISNIKDEIDFRESVPDRGERDAIREIKLQNDIVSLREATEMYRRESR